MKKSKAKQPFTIIVDSREQRPLVFPDDAIIVKALMSGDYSLDGFEHRIAIERKSINDLFSVIGNGRERFERELERLAKLERACIVVEGNLADVLEGARWSKVYPKAAVGSLFSWWVKYGVAPIFAGNRLLAAATVRKILVKFAELD